MVCPLPSLRNGWDYTEVDMSQLEDDLSTGLTHRPSDRLSNGQFAPGNRAQTGPTGYKAQIVRALRQRWDADRVLELLEDSYTLALEKRNVKGLTDLAELVLSYLLGKPEQSVQISTEDSNSMLMAILSDRTPLLPPRQGVIEAADTLALGDSRGIALLSRESDGDDDGEGDGDDDDVVDA